LPIHNTTLAMHPLRNRSWLAAAIGAALAARLTFAADTGSTPPSADLTETASNSGSTTLSTVEVSATLDRSRNQLSPSIGASQYVIDAAAIAQLPLGDATPLNQILLRAPGVVQDSFGQVHIRGDHGDLQYRINGVVLPESIEGFGQTLDPALIERVQVLTGALPAQYGYRTAGVVEITTESGAHQHDEGEEGEAGGGRFGVLTGSFGTLNSEWSGHGRTDRLSYFYTVEYAQSEVGIENPTPARNALHDQTHQLRGFGYVSYLLDEQTRISLMLGAANDRFQIPDRPDQAPTYTLAGAPPLDSAKLDERQRENFGFGVLALDGALGTTHYQVSLGQRYTAIHYQPDPIGDLIFNGVASSIARSNRATTLQTDFSTPLAGGTHTLRYGLFVANERPVSNDTARVFPADADGMQTSTIPITIIDDAPRIRARTYGVYLQDEWDLNDRLTVNYGIRGDRVRAYVHEAQLSPRLGLVYTPTDTTTLHAGYARYFTPPPTELISQTDIARFQGTTNQLPSDVNAETRAERSHYFDIGVSQKIGAGITLGLDAYYRKVRNLLDEGQFGAALVFSPFNYERGRVRGIEFTTSYTAGDFSAYLNLAWSRAMGKNVVTGQYNFGADELAYIATHWVHLDHDQRLTSSGGIAYDWQGTKLAADFLFGSGLRAGFANTTHLPSYWQVNLSANRDWDLPSLGKVNLRLALINVTDEVYQLRDGTGIGVGAPQFGPRRGVYLGLTKSF
jgi:outer membrane receptor protein involved in Fe transport